MIKASTGLLRSPNSKQFLCEVLILGLITTAAVILSLRLWKANLNIPLQYNIKETKFFWANFDINYFLAYIKNILEGGWVDSIKRLSAPEKLESYSFPFPFFPIAIFASAKLIHIITNFSLGLTVNLLYIFSFFTASIASFAVFRLYFNFLLSVVLGVLFAFIPYHFETGMIFAEQGFTYGYVIPLSGLTALWLAQGEFFDRTSAGKIKCNRKKIAVAIVAIVLTAMSNTYYPVFTALFWFVAGLLALLNQPKNLKIPSLFLTCGLLLGLAITLLILVAPVMLHRLQFPTATSTFVRNWQDSEFWGLKIIQLYLPIREHYIPAFTEFARRYGPYPYSHVNASVALGAIGAVGFTSLITAFFIEKLPVKRPALFKTLACLNLVAVLVSTVAGYGTLFAFTVTPEFRSLYRIAPYISFFSFFAAGFLIQTGLQRLSTLAIGTTRKQVSCTALLLLILGLGIADQTGYLAVPQYQSIEKTFSAHAVFFRDLEPQLPRKAMVFQLPYEKFPEGGKLNFEGQWMANASFIPFLHTKRLRWSYGSTRSSTLDLWNQKVAALPVPVMVQELCKANFAAILLDYQQSATRQEAQTILDQLTQQTHLILKSQEGRYAAFRICQPNQK